MVSCKEKGKKNDDDSDVCYKNLFDFSGTKYELLIRWVKLHQLL